MIARGRSAPLAVAALTLIALVWGYNWVVMKRAGQAVDEFDFLAWRFILAAGCLFAVLRLRGRPIAIGHHTQVAAIGLLLSGMTFALMMFALKAGAAGKVAVLSFSMPFFVVLMAWPVLGERPRGLQWLAIGIALAGFTLLTNLEARLRLPDLLALASGFTWAAANVISKRLQSRDSIDPLALNAWQLLAGGIALAALSMPFSTRPWAWTPYVVFAVAFNVVIVSALSWFAWFWVLQRLDSGVASLGTLAVPAVAVVSGVIELGERPSALEWGGIALVVVALGVTARAAGATATARDPA